MSNTELSQVVARYIMVHFSEFVTVGARRGADGQHCLGYMDELDIMDTAGTNVHFSSSFVYCLAAICSMMNGRFAVGARGVENLDGIIRNAHFDFFQVFKACLQQVLVSYEQATIENDREDFLFALQGLLRLLAVMTYDAVLCQEFASADIERAAAIQQPASTDMELLPLLCSILLEAPNSLCILLISCVLQNMSSCSGLFSLPFSHAEKLGACLSLQNQWFALLGAAIQNELRAIESGSYTPFALEQLLFIPQSPAEQRDGSLLYLTFLLDHFLHAASNLTCLNGAPVWAFRA